MIIYLEKRAKDFPLSQKILNKFHDAEVILIDHYKNIFDKNIGNYRLAQSIILAYDPNPKIYSTPNNYGYPYKSFFFKSVLNCIFDCKYCYLKGAFKNRFITVFVNYQDIANTILNHISSIRESGYTDKIVYYASNYADIQAIDNLIDFNDFFMPFFDSIPNVLCETRTKSNNISALLDRTNVPSNTEIAFSLNPQSIIERYEIGTSNLDSRIESINKLLAKGYKVGLRFLPLLPVPDYENIYSEFLLYVSKKINISKINSIFIGSLIYTYQDWKNIQKKSDIEFFSDFSIGEDNFVRLPKAIMESFYSIFKKHIPNKEILKDIY